MRSLCVTYECVCVSWWRLLSNRKVNLPSCLCVACLKKFLLMTNKRVCFSSFVCRRLIAPLIRSAAMDLGPMPRGLPCIRSSYFILRNGRVHFAHNWIDVVAMANMRFVFVWLRVGAFVAHSYRWLCQTVASSLCGKTDDIGRVIKSLFLNQSFNWIPSRNWPLEINLSFGKWIEWMNTTALAFHKRNIHNFSSFISVYNFDESQHRLSMYELQH